MKAREWYNQMGWDVGGAEVMKVAGGRLKVQTLPRFALVSSTNDPVEATLLTERFGLLRNDLESMHPEIADALVRSHVL